MRIRHLTPAAVWLVAGTLAAATPTAEVSSLAWMEGRWTGSQDGVQTEEHWTAPEGGMLIGMHKDVKNGRVFFEFLRIAATPEGDVIYYASPRGAAPTPFRRVESGERRVVFENKEHDFPQRILYWREGDALHARVEGPAQGKVRVEEWTWKKS